MKKRKAILAILLLLHFAGYTQGMVIWNAKAEKVRENQYRITITADISPEHHIFSINQPKNSMAFPTSIKLRHNQYTKQLSDFIEVGEVTHVPADEPSLDAWHLSGMVVFSCLVEAKNHPSKTILNGDVEFQACSETYCYLPKKVEFSVALNP